MMSKFDIYAPININVPISQYERSRVIGWVIEFAWVVWHHFSITVMTQDLQESLLIIKW